MPALGWKKVTPFTEHLWSTSHIPVVLWEELWRHRLRLQGFAGARMPCSDGSPPMGLFGWWRQNILEAETFSTLNGMVSHAPSLCRYSDGTSSLRPVWAWCFLRGDCLTSKLAPNSLPCLQSRFKGWPSHNVSHMINFQSMLERFFHLFSGRFLQHPAVCSFLAAFSSVEQRRRVWTPGRDHLLLPGCVTLDKSHKLCVPQFPYSQKKSIVIKIKVKCLRIVI